MGKELHFYSNGTDTVIAQSLEDAIKVWEETTGTDFSDDYDEFELLDVGDNGKIELHFVDDPPGAKDVPLGGRRVYPSPYVEATQEQWIKQCARCFFSSTEY